MGSEDVTIKKNNRLEFILFIHLMKFNKLLKFILVAVLLSIGGNSYAQVTIGQDKEPEKFSVLEIISNGQRGLRMPHLTTQERDDMTNSSEFQALKSTLAKGLTIYNVDNKGIEFWDGTKWILICDIVMHTLSGTTTKVHKVSDVLFLLDTGYRLPGSTPVSDMDIMSKNSLGYYMTASIL